jgi:hypothetical protein
MENAEFYLAAAVANWFAVLVYFALGYYIYKQKALWQVTLIWALFALYVFL